MIPASHGVSNHKGVLQPVHFITPRETTACAGHHAALHSHTTQVLNVLKPSRCDNVCSLQLSQLVTYVCPLAVKTHAHVCASEGHWQAGNGHAACQTDAQ
jgi:hypothetical protein